MKHVAKFLIIALAVLAMSVPSTTKVSAATTKASYTTVKTDLSKTFKDNKGHSVKLDYYYNRIKLKGNSAAVKKINKQLKAYSDKFMKDKSSMYNAAKDNFKYYTSSGVINTANSKVVYNQNGIISIKVTTFWCGGTVGSDDAYGYTFRLKDGKLLKLTDVCKGKSADIRNAIWYQAGVEGIPSMSFSFTQNKIDISKIHFYVKSDKEVAICFTWRETGNTSTIESAISRNIKPTSKLDDGLYQAEFAPQSEAKTNSFAVKYGNIYKLAISDNRLVVYGSFSKDGKMYSSAKRTFPIDGVCAGSGVGQTTINLIKKNVCKGAFFGFRIKGGMITYLSFVE